MPATPRPKKHLKDLSFNGVPLIGCQEASIDTGADEISHSGCDDDGIAYGGLTRVLITASAKIAGGPNFLRDLKAVDFDGAIGAMRSAELAEVGDILSDDSDGDGFISYLEIVDRRVEASLTTRDMVAALGAEFGKVDSLSISCHKPGLAFTSGLVTGATTAQAFTAASMMLLAPGATGKHKELAEAKLSFKSVDNIVDVDGDTDTPIHVGDVGDFEFTLVGTGGEDDMTITAAGAVLTEKRIGFQQGEMVTWDFSFQVPSADGATSPLSVA